MDRDRVPGRIETRESSTAVAIGGECAALKMSQRKQDVPESTKIFVAGAGKLAAKRVPTFHVGRDLIHSAIRTQPPEGLKWADAPMPMDTGIFLLPKGAIQTADGEHWDWVAWVKFDCNESVQLPGLWGNYTRIGADDGHDLFAVLTCATPRNGKPSLPIYWGISTGYPIRTAVAEWQDRSDHLRALSLTGAEHATLSHMVDVVANLFFAMAARPELVERDGRKVRTIKNGPAREEWTPNWIGRAYRVQRADGDGTHASPRLHWRRGHYRRQACGTGRKEHKIIWLEPCLVGGGDTDG